MVVKISLDLGVIGYEIVPAVPSIVPLPPAADGGVLCQGARYQRREATGVANAARTSRALGASGSADPVASVMRWPA